MFSCVGLAGRSGSEVAPRTEGSPRPHKTRPTTPMVTRMHRSRRLPTAIVDLVGVLALSHRLLLKIARDNGYHYCCGSQPLIRHYGDSI
jgi:hypothetical protein